MNLNWSCDPETLKSERNRPIFRPLFTLKFVGWPRKTIPFYGTYSGVTVRKRLIRVKIVDFTARVTLKFDISMPRQALCIILYPSMSNGNFGFRTPTLVWLWVSAPSLSNTVLVNMGKSDVIFKMAAWRPYWMFRILDSVGGMVSEA